MSWQEIRFIVLQMLHPFPARKWSETVKMCVGLSSWPQHNCDVRKERNKQTLECCVLGYKIKMNHGNVSTFKISLEFPSQNLLKMRYGLFLSCYILQEVSVSNLSV